jgi:ectoine hydroxylase-related dioxygenase (phytanoyl-CoA dioxygenase family)
MTYIESSYSFHKETYDKYGVFILRNTVPTYIVEQWQQEWKNFYEQNLSKGRDVHKANPVALKEQLPEKLAKMYRNDALVNIAKQVHGENVALYNHRFVIKDQYSLDKVFLHQDSCYHLGYLNKCSFFVPLSYVDETNGGLSFYLGSHKCGYLGDAGEINPDSFPFKFEKITI